MDAIIMHMLHSHAYLLIFSAAYFLLFRASRAPRFKRFYMLATMFLSWLLPLLPSFSLSIPEHVMQPVRAMHLPEFVVGAEAARLSAHDMILIAVGNMKFIGLLILVAGIFMVALTLVRTLRILMMVRSHQVVAHDGLHLVLTGGDQAPFSFFRYVFLPEKIFGGANFDRVLAHERAHAVCGHSYDILFMEMMRAVSWFNPAFYYLNRELRAQHEFEADMIACRHTDRHAYQATLLNFTIGGNFIPLTNPFNVSLIKQRIMMMNQKTHAVPAGLWLKVLLILPFLLVAVCMQSCQEQRKEESVTALEVAAEEAAVDYGNDEVFTVVEQPPVFPGGEEARVFFLQEHLKYPASARELGVQGVVYLSFVVRYDGTIDDVKVVRSAAHELEVRYAGSEHDLEALRAASQALDEEAMRVVKMMPKWTPGTQREKAVSVQFNMPVRYALN